jgi:hypothetical protein
MPWTSMKNTVTAGFLGIRQRLANVRRCADILATYAHDDVAFAEALASGFAARIDIGHDDTFGIVVQVMVTSNNLVLRAHRPSMLRAAAFYG